MRQNIEEGLVHGLGTFTKILAETLGGTPDLSVSFSRPAGVPTLTVGPEDDRFVTTITERDGELEVVFNDGRTGVGRQAATEALLATLERHMKELVEAFPAEADLNRAWAQRLGLESF